jgi:hypothetical protein
MKEGNFVFLCIYGMYIPTLYKIINNYTYIDDSARPVISGSGITRMKTNDNRIKFLIPYAKTVTFQSSYFIRACKTWNILSDNLRDRNIGFYAFKSGLKLYSIF